MAAPTITLVTKFRDISRRNKTLIIIATLGAGNYTPGGLTIDWTTVTNPAILPGGKPAANPTNAEVLNSPNGFSGELIAGTTMHNWLLKINTTGGTELGAVAIPAGLLADPFQLQVIGPLGNF